MLLLARKLGDISFSALMEVYRESNQKKAEEEWRKLPTQFALQQAEQDFYLYMKDVFFRLPDACYAIWVDSGQYVSALRLEPYRDGLLLTALETHPDYRKNGYAQKLINAVCAEKPGVKIYSHIHRKNAASLKVHSNCGFRKILDHASYLDGSVDYRACTFLYE